ncbi:hypothetical protein BRC63_11005 [Halobacteriales archaeon QH_10_70_21]|nr:MAG: hypothetical protein BRC63_11005 [Halobacteriales archaeon QH_10_70_21]
MFKDAAIYPKDGTDATKTVLIGGVLTLLSFLLVPLFLLVGYTVRVVRAVAGGDETLPVFDEWGDVLVDGVKGFAITLAYFPFAAVAAPVGPGRASTLVVLGGLAAMPVALVVWYVATAGFVNFAVTGRVRAAFAFDDLRLILTSGGFATGWLVGLAVLVVGSVVGGIVGAIPILGLVSAFMIFYTTVAVSYCYARGFADAPRSTRRPGCRRPTPPPDAAGCTYLERGCLEPRVTEPLPSNISNESSRTYSRQYERPSTVEPTVGLRSPGGPAAADRRFLAPDAPKDGYGRQVAAPPPLGRDRRAVGVARRPPRRRSRR